MFKILVLQVLYGLSDDQTEFRSSTGAASAGSSVWTMATALPMQRRSGCSGRR